MEFIIWKPCYCIGEATIDYQHRRLVALLNVLHQKIYGAFSETIIEKALIELINYVEVHFRDEEEIMKRINYPYYREHCEEHERLVEEIFVFKAKYEQGQVSKYDLLEFLKDWLVNHILDSDLKIKHFLR